MLVGDEVDSDHHPLIVSIRGKCKSSKGGEKSKSCRGIWTEESVGIFQKKIKGIRRGEGEYLLEEK